MTAQTRDNKWLLSRFDHIWSKYFEDVVQDNPVFVKFGRFARLRLGSIRFDKRTKNTVITITSMFKLESIPQEVVDYTIAHELVHYSHGFSSPNPRLHKYPHAGGLIKREMSNRGLNYLYKAHRAWIKSYRKTLLKYG